MQVAHLTSVHPARDVRIYVKECRSLKDAGHGVTLIAPGISDGVDECGIVNLGVTRGRGRLARMLGTTWQVFRRASRLRPDVVHFHDPELLPVSLLLKLRGCKVVYDVHENVPDQILDKHWLPRALRPLISGLMDLTERTSARLLDGIVAATPRIASRFPPHKTVTVQNFPILSEFASVPQPVDAANHPPRLVYVGVIAEVRGIMHMVRALEIARRSRPDLRLVVAGNFLSEELKGRVMAMAGWQGVDFAGWLTREQIAALLSTALAGMVVLHPTPSYREAYPVKMFEYMAAGIPVIASDFPLWRQIVAESDCGLLVDPLDSQAIANVMLRLISNPHQARRMGASGAMAVRSRYNWDAEAGKLIGLYSRLSTA